MDMRRLIRVGARPASLEGSLGYAALVSALSAAQGGGRTAQAAAGIEELSLTEKDPVDALATLLDSAPLRRAARTALRGSFHPAIAGEITGKGSSTEMTEAFTSAFQPSFKAGEVER